MHTEENPADEGTRPAPPPCLAQTLWFKGPAFLFKPPTESVKSFDLVEPEQDLEIRPQVRSYDT